LDFLRALLGAGQPDTSAADPNTPPVDPNVSVDPNAITQTALPPAMPSQQGGPPSPSAAGSLPQTDPSGGAASALPMLGAQNGPTSQGSVLDKLPQIQSGVPANMLGQLPQAQGQGPGGAQLPQAQPQGQAQALPQTQSQGPSGSAATLPQMQPQGQPQARGLVGKIGNILALPLNMLDAVSTTYGNIPAELAQARQLRDQEIQKGQLGLRNSQAYAGLIGSIFNGPDDSGSNGGAAPSAPTPTLPQSGSPPPSPSPQAAPALAPSLPQMSSSQAPHGIRNLNPGNVQALPNGQQWQGQTGVDDQGYAQFGSMQDGIRAALVNLHNYGARDGVSTVQGVIQRWSPGAPDTYAQSVAAGLGVKPTDRIDLNDPNTLTSVAKGIFSFENGAPWGQGDQTQQTGSTSGSAAGPALNSGGSPGAAGAQALPQRQSLAGQLPQVGSGSVGLAPRAQKGLAMMALLGGNPEQAATIMSGDVTSDSNGNLIDHKTGRVLGHVPAASYVNGYRVDPNAPNAPGFVPKLPDGTMPDGRGGVVAIPGAAAATQQQKFAETSGANQANWPGDLISVPMGDGTTRTMSRSQFAAMTNGSGGQGGGSTPAGPGSAAGGPGVASPSAAQTEFDKDQAGDASKTLSMDMDARPQALQDLDSARTALAYVQAHPNGLNPATPFKVAGANYLRSLSPETLNSVGIPAGKINQYANDLGVYQRLSAENLLTFSKSHLPSRYTEREMAVASKVIPGLTTTPDAATFHWGLQAAVANKALQRADFSANYQGAPSRQTVEQAWNTTPAGQASLFEDPVWQGLKIGGKPAVVFTRDPQSGRTVGVVGMGTSAPTTFFASGAH
jgi:hypothetical protein